jgi:hypothetical protein
MSNILFWRPQGYGAPARNIPLRGRPRPTALALSHFQRFCIGELHAVPRRAGVNKNHCAVIADFSACSGSVGSTKRALTPNIS